MPLIAAIIIIFITSVLLVSSEPRHEPLPPQTSPFDRRIIDLEREAIDEAFRQQITHLFFTWMKDDSGQPERALKGTRQARKAYISAMTAIDIREKQLHEQGR
jgi:hypothetical protein